MTRELIYLGWLGAKNFGDDLIYESWRAAIDRPLDLVAPLHCRDYIRHPISSTRSVLRARSGESVILLGGGTTLGFDIWARHVDLTQRVFGSARVVAAGAGAAASTDSYLTGLQEQDWSR